MKLKSNKKELIEENVDDIKVLLMSIITVLLVIITGIVLAFIMLGGR